MNATRPIHIMHLLPSLEIGGMENGVVNVVNNLDASRFCSSICCIERQGPLRDRLHAAVKVIVLGQKEGIRWGLPFLLKRVLRENSVDIVHTHNFYTLFYGLPAARMARVPVVIHGEHGRAGDINNRRTLMAAFLSRRTDAVVAVSQDLKQFLVKQGMPESKISVILNGIDTARFPREPLTAGERERLGIAGTGPVIGTVGRLTTVKDYPTLIKSFADVKRLIPDTRLVFIGSGPQQVELQRLCASLGVAAAVTFLGERNDVHRLYRLFDIFVLTSLSEGMSNAVLEAMAAGLPVIATRVGDNPLLVKEPASGRLIAPGDVEGLTAALLGMMKDKGMALRMGEEGRRRAREEFGFARMIGAYETLYGSQAVRKTVVKEIS